MKRVIALGFFDGVHIGHGKLLQKTREQASRLDAKACALTFEGHPLSMVTGRPVPLLCSKEERADLIRDMYRIPDVVFMPFDKAMMKLPWNRYIEEIIVKKMEAAHVVAGYDFTFGYQGEGTPEMLQGACAELNIGCDIIPPKRLNGVRVSSTYIRGLVAEGDMERAADFLGHPYCLSGVVVEGKRLGRQLGFPTVNITLPTERQWPAFGVYATKVLVNEALHPAVTNVGLCPTIETSTVPTVESTLLDWAGELYGKRVRVLFYRFLRPEQKFSSPEALREQIEKDAQLSRNLFDCEIFVK